MYSLYFHTVPKNLAGCKRFLKKFAELRTLIDHSKIQT